jgi:hypothetical protein
MRVLRITDALHCIRRGLFCMLCAQSRYSLSVSAHTAGNTATCKQPRVLLRRKLENDARTQRHKSERARRSASAT